MLCSAPQEQSPCNPAAAPLGVLCWLAATALLSQSGWCCALGEMPLLCLTSTEENLGVSPALLVNNWRPGCLLLPLPFRAESLLVFTVPHIVFAAFVCNCSCSAFAFLSQGRQSKGYNGKQVESHLFNASKGGGQSPWPHQLKPL